jgi:GH43 family beta-xylosidase
MVWNDSWWLHDLCVLSNMPAYSWWSTLYCIKGGWFIYFAINNRLIIIPIESNSLFCQNM